MKKLNGYLAIVLIIVMSGFASLSEEQMLVGVWQLDNNSLTEQIGIDDKGIAQFWTLGLASYLEFMDNGSCTMSYTGESIIADLLPQLITNDEGCWDESRKKIYFSSLECDYSLGDDELILSLYGLKLKYNRVRIDTQTVVFGRNPENMDEVKDTYGLEWNILEERESTLILISKDGIYLSHYSDNGSTDFSNSVIAHWLESFYDNAFSEEEKSRMNYISIDDAGNILSNKSPNEHQQSMAIIMNLEAHNKYIQNNRDALTVVSCEGRKYYWLNESFYGQYIYEVDNSGNIYLCEPDTKAYIRPIICINTN